MATETAAAAASIAQTDDELRKEALHQVEFYFADSNLPFDRFMWQLHTANAEHWVPIETISGFKRMRGYKDKFGVSGIADALRASAELLEVDEFGTKVRRKTEVKEPIGQFDRTVYVKGFGEDKDDQQALERFFRQFGAIAAVRIRRDQNKAAKDSCFVEFAAPSDMEKFLALDPKPKWKENELLIMTKEAYCTGKLKEKNLPLSELAKMRDANTAHPRQKGFNAFRDDASGSNSKAKKKAAAANLPEVYIKYLGHDLRVWRFGENGATAGGFDEWQWVKPEDVPHVPGTVITLTGFGDFLDFKVVKAALKEAGIDPPPYIENKRGETSAAICFTEVVSDDVFARIQAALPKIGDKDLTWARADTELEHRLQQERANALGQRALGSDAKPAASRGGRGGGRGGRGGRGGGRTNDRNAERSAKGKDKAAAPASEDKMDVDAPAAAGGGVKRKRDQVEPDGGVTQGTRGQGIPTIGRAEKKAKVDETDD